HMGAWRNRLVRLSRLLRPAEHEAVRWRAARGRKAAHRLFLGGRGTGRGCEVHALQRRGRNEAAERALSEGASAVHTLRRRGWPACDWTEPVVRQGDGRKGGGPALSA